MWIYIGKRKRESERERERKKEEIATKKKNDTYHMMMANIDIDSSYVRMKSDWKVDIDTIRNIQLNGQLICGWTFLSKHIYKCISMKFQNHIQI